MPLEQLFAAVPVAVATLVNADLTSLLRFDLGDRMTPLAGWSAHDLMAPVGQPQPLELLGKMMFRDDAHELPPNLVPLGHPSRTITEPVAGRWSRRPLPPVAANDFKAVGATSPPSKQHSPPTLW